MKLAEFGCTGLSRSNSLPDPPSVVTPTSIFAQSTLCSHRLTRHHQTTAINPSPICSPSIYRPATVFARVPRLALGYDLSLVARHLPGHSRGMARIDPHRAQQRHPRSNRYLVTNSDETTTSEGGKDSLLECYPCEVRRYFL